MQTQEIQENQDFSDVDVVLVPPIEQNQPIPPHARDALPPLTNEQEIEMVGNTIKLISDLTGQRIQATQEDIDEAKTVIKTIIKEPEKKLNIRKYKNNTLAALAGMVAELDAQVVDDLKDLKTFVINGLIKEATMSDKAKERITALRAIGEVDGVDAFKKRSEITHKILSAEEVEKELLETLQSLEGKVIDVEAREVIKNDAKTDA